MNDALGLLSAIALVWSGIKWWRTDLPNAARAIVAAHQEKRRSKHYGDLEARPHVDHRLWTRGRPNVHQLGGRPPDYVYRDANGVVLYEGWTDAPRRRVTGPPRTTEERIQLAADYLERADRIRTYGASMSPEAEERATANAEAVERQALAILDGIPAQTIRERAEFLEDQRERREEIRKLEEWQRRADDWWESAPVLSPPVLPVESRCHYCHAIKTHDPGCRYGPTPWNTSMI